ncbi:MAG: hypothetical protein EA427_13715 [Spirochaetaceae bacterium]|nr:MAG: hypothetical protein EA427_13715 [Spirochaetaceae bacterium]
MRERKRIALFMLVLLASVIPAVADETVHEVRSDHYRVVSEVSRNHAEQTADHLEAMMALYNRHFRFPLNELETPLRVRVFANRSRYEDYVRRLVQGDRREFLYLHYGDPAKNELVGYAGENDELHASFVHQSFLQFLRTFIANPPLWIREGFAVHFEATRYDPDFGAAHFQENLAWLDTLKLIVSGESSPDPIPLDDMLALSLPEAREMVDIFYPQAWGMVNFLINSSRPETNRLLWDSISALSPGASLEENGQNVYSRVFRWVDQAALTEEFVRYVQERRTFRGWVEYALEAWESGDSDEAERGFVQAGTLRDDHYVPFYFLGLINYERGNYTLADYYYQQALERGAEEPVTLYALGLNAYADNRFEEARSYLEKTIRSDPDYRERAEDILRRIGG